MEAYRVTPDAPVLNVMLYGDAGTGKTSLAASAQDHPEMENVMFANVEGGLLSVAHRGDIHAVDIKSMDELEELFWTIAKGEEYQTVQTIVLDSATEMQTVNLEQIVEAAVEKGGSSRSGKVRTRDDIWQDDYGKSTTQMKRIIRRFKDLPKNLIVTALAKRTYPKVPEGADITNVEPVAVVPSLTAKLGESVMGYMDMVWYTYIEAGDGDTPPQFKMLTQRSGPYFAKTRGIHFAAALGQVVSNPNMTDIYNLLVQSQKGAVPKSAPAKKKVVRR